MNIEEEIHDRLCSIKCEFLDEEEAGRFATLIKKARSATKRPKAWWYLAWADSLVYKSRMKVDVFSCVKLK